MTSLSCWPAGRKPDQAKAQKKSDQPRDAELVVIAVPDHFDQGLHTARSQGVGNAFDRESDAQSQQERLQHAYSPARPRKYSKNSESGGITMGVPSWIAKS